MNEADSLRALRDRIDALDRQIQTLISERARCAQASGRDQAGRWRHRQFLSPRARGAGAAPGARNQSGAAEQRRNGPAVPRDHVGLSGAGRAATHRLSRPGRDLHQAAALKHFGKSIHSIPLRAIDEVFREVEAGSADYGVVPVENSTEGVVNHTLDMFLQSPLRICGEVQIRINHHLITRAAELRAIRRIYSHRQSLAQCREWLDANLPRVEQVEVSSNGEAALRVRDEADAAAIAGQCAADIYQLPTLVRNIEDEPNNTTRFLIIGTQPIAPSGDDKTALLVAGSTGPAHCSICWSHWPGTRSA